MLFRSLDDGDFPNRHPTEITQASDFYRERNNPIESFLLFINFIENEGFYDAVTVPQTTFLRERALLIDDIDNVFIQENLTNEYDIFKNKYDIKARLPKNNAGNGETTKLLIDLINSDENLKERISKLYKSDMELYRKLTQDKK